MQSSLLPPNPLGNPLPSQSPYISGVLPGGGLCDTPALSGTRPISLPADDAPHSSDPLNYWEWWFWTGHLEAKLPGGGTRPFAFAVDFESKPQLHIQQALYTLHDLKNQTVHYGRQGLILGDPTPTANGFSLHGPHSSAVGGGGRDTLHEDVDGYSLDIDLRSLKPAVLQFGDGHVSFYCNDAFYYQRQHMAVSGSLMKNGVTMPLTGISWEDHMWGFDPGYQPARSDYLLFNLADGTDIFLGDGRLSVPVDASNPRLVPESRLADVRVGSISDRNGKVTSLLPGDFTLTPTAYFTPTPTCSYPVAYDVTVKGRHYHVEASIRDAELRSTPAPLNNGLWVEDPTFWDGATRVTGDGTGLGWLDLVHYCIGR